MTSGVSATRANTQRWGMAFSLWYPAGKPLVLTLPRRRKGRDWMRTRKLGRPCHASGRRVRAGRRRGPLNLSIGTIEKGMIENYRGTGERK